MIESRKIIQAICYTLRGVKRANKLKLVKLLYLADKYHIVHYGRTVTGDEYWAMDYGPVGSTTKDILSMDKDFLSQEYDEAARFLKKKGPHDFIIGEPCSDDDLDFLSDTDKEAIDFVVERFGKLSSNELIAYTHKYPEWAQYEEVFNNRKSKRQRISTEELVSLLDNDCISTPDDQHIQESKEILTGMFS
jgi:uncharacterized phage-associated protein